MPISEDNIIHTRRRMPFASNNVPFRLDTKPSEATRRPIVRPIVPPARRPFPHREVDRPNASARMPRRTVLLEHERQNLRAPVGVDPLPVEITDLTADLEPLGLVQSHRGVVGRRHMQDDAAQSLRSGSRDARAKQRAACAAPPVQRGDGEPVHVEGAGSPAGRNEAEDSLRLVVSPGDPRADAGLKAEGNARVRKDVRVEGHALREADDVRAQKTHDEERRRAVDHRGTTTPQCSSLLDWRAP